MNVAPHTKLGRSALTATWRRIVRSTRESGCRRTANHIFALSTLRWHRHSTTGDEDCQRSLRAAILGFSALAAAATTTEAVCSASDPPSAAASELGQWADRAESAARPSASASAVVLSMTKEYSANGPIEDRHDVRQTARGDFFASVYDGHGGWQCAEFARKRLITVAQAELEHTLARSADQVNGALTQAFLRVEREYLCQVRAAFDSGFGSVARTGACALLALVRDNKLYVANAGDCRAVLGRRKTPFLGGGEGDLEAVALSNDHNARVAEEQDKLRRLHPYEADIVMCKKVTACYVKNKLQPTRSLGDAYLKYSEFNGQPDTHSSSGRYLPPPYTPPYITAEPEIHVHNIDHKKDQFVIMASDGLWDYVSSAEAAEIVETAAYRDGQPDSACDRLVQRVLEAAAGRHKLTVDALKKVDEGSKRRGMHDDITCIVFFLSGNKKNDGFPRASSSGARRPLLPAQ